MIVRFLSLIIEFIVTYSDYFCYLFMLVSMMVSAGILTLFYPFIVFGYALLEENNPSKTCWKVILVYTMGLVLIMFVY